jgi:hypothetical protein
MQSVGELIRRARLRIARSCLSSRSRLTNHSEATNAMVTNTLMNAMNARKSGCIDAPECRAVLPDPSLRTRAASQRFQRNR